ncbi:UNVERIFIED_CONTAM: Tetraspanin-8 [Sesamum calycinum]|uniref:Tetraspanin-8 n=1 Tax=Sesamum calycinum TaxID=2727403 RepID=A0AAW2RTF2_9LAMI
MANTECERFLDKPVIALGVFILLGAGEALSDKGYKEYRLGDYSNWLQKRSTITGPRSGVVWLIAIVMVLDLGGLFAFLSGCCKPSNDCNFQYISPTNWTQTPTSSLKNPDCSTWSSDPNVLCYNCQSCKAGLLDNIKSDWKRVAVINIVFLVFLIIVYSWMLRVQEQQGGQFLETISLNVVRVTQCVFE